MNKVYILLLLDSPSVQTQSVSLSPHDSKILGTGHLFEGFVVGKSILRQYDACMFVSLQSRQTDCIFLDVSFFPLFQ